jgi:hypothetical protein
MEAQSSTHGQDHFAESSAVFSLLTQLLVYANLSPVVGGLNQSGSLKGFRELREAT